VLTDLVPELPLAVRLVPKVRGAVAVYSLMKLYFVNVDIFKELLKKLLREFSVKLPYEIHSFFSRNLAVTDFLSGII